MIDVNKIRRAVVKGLKEHLGIEVIRSNQTGNPPSYPYLSYTITTLQTANKGTWGQYDDGIDRKPTSQIWSITVQSDDVSEAMNLASKAHTWIDYSGKTFLEDNGVIVQSVGNVSNRDNLLTIEYEYRNGFDVVFWLFDETESPAAETGYIESADFDVKEEG